MNAEIDISNVTLRTERLILRPWTMKDVDDMYEYAKAEGVGIWAGWLPHKNREESQNIVESFIKQKKVLAIEYEGKVIGSLGIENYEESDYPELEKLKARELGYVLSKDYWGRGLMTEAVKEVIRYLFEEEFLWDFDYKFCPYCGKEITIYDKKLTDMYLTNSQLITDELGFSKFLSDNSVKTSINAVWCPDGKNWSDRVWSNKALLEERVKNGIVDCIARGASKDELVEQLINDFNVGFNMADRLARTELSFVQNKAALDKYEEAGITEYEILVGDDGSSDGTVNIIEE